MNSLKQITMFVFNRLATDARVQRSVQALSKQNRIRIFSYGKKMKFSNNVVNITVGSNTGKMNYFKYLIFLIKSLILSDSDVYYGHDYYSLPILYLLTRLKKNKKIIYDAHELLLDFPNKKQTRREKFFIFFEKLVINKVVCIAASEDRAKIMKDFYHLDRLPIVVENISLLKDSGQKFHSKIIDAIRSFKKKSSFLYGYTGSLSEERNICKFITDIIDNSADSVLIVGDGDQKDKIRKLYSNNDRVLLINTVPYNQLYAVTSFIDAGILQYPTTDWNNRFCASNKIFEYASVGKPFIFYDNPTLENISKKYSFCIKVKGDTAGLSDYICSNKEKIQNHINSFLAENSEENLNAKIQKAVGSKSI